MKRFIKYSITADSNIVDNFDMLQRFDQSPFAERILKFLDPIPASFTVKSHDCHRKNVIFGSPVDLNIAPSRGHENDWGEFVVTAKVYPDNSDSIDEFRRKNGPGYNSSNYYYGENVQVTKTAFNKFRKILSNDLVFLVEFRFASNPIKAELYFRRDSFSDLSTDEFLNQMFN